MELKLEKVLMKDSLIEDFFHQHRGELMGIEQQQDLLQDTLKVLLVVYIRTGEASSRQGIGGIV